MRSPMTNETSLSNRLVLMVVVFSCIFIGWVIGVTYTERKCPAYQVMPCIGGPASTSGANSHAITGGDNSITYPEKEK